VLDSGTTLQLAGMGVVVFEEGQGLEKCENVQDHNACVSGMSQHYRLMRVEAKQVSLGWNHKAENRVPNCETARGRDNKDK
jgi:hypothetical protein